MPDNMRQERDRFYSPDFEFAIDRRIVTSESRHDSVHWHDYCEVEYVCSGEGVHLLNNRRLELRPGSIYVVTPLDFHRVYAAEGSVLDLYHLQFGCAALQPDLMRRVTEDQAAMPPGIHVQLGEEARERVRAGLEELRGEFFQRRPDSVMLMRACLERLCILILREAERGARAEGHPTAPDRTEDVPPGDAAHPVSQAVQYVRYNFRGPVTLAMVARHVHLSNNYFGELFHAVMGVSFSEYLRRCRLEYARRLLLETRLSMLEIARESGFRTPSYFSDVFRRQYGATPTELHRNSIETATEDLL